MNSAKSAACLNAARRIPGFADAQGGLQFNDANPGEDIMAASQRPLGGAIFVGSAFGAAAIVAWLAIPAPAQPVQSLTGIPGVLAPGVAPELVQEGYVFTEGPVGTGDGGLYFSDIRVSKTYLLDPGGKISVARENTNGANGLALTRDGELLFAEGDGKRITRRNRDGTIAVLTEGPPGAPLLAPNDLIVDAKGGIYFTDPGPRPVVPGRPTYVYYLPAGAKTPILIDSAVPRPNGLTLTNNGRTLIVDDTLNPTVFAYDVQADGSVKNKRAFLQLRDIPPGAESGADGLAIDRDDRLYITTVAGVQVFDSKGQYLGTIKAGRQAANAAFSGADKQTLYLTAREGLYRVKTLVKGPDRLGK
jgi:gluconolactonase